MIPWLKSKLKKQPNFVAVGIVNQEILDTLEMFNREWDQVQEEQALELWEQLEKAKEEVLLLTSRHNQIKDAYELRHKALWAQMREVYGLPLQQDCRTYVIDTKTKQIGYVR